MMPRFDHPSGSLVFAGAPRRPVQDLRTLQPDDESAGGVRFVGDPVANESALTLLWPRMILADWQALQTFFDTVDGMAETFTYTDSAGLARTVRFAKPELVATEIAFERYAVTVQLLED